MEIKVKGQNNKKILEVKRLYNFFILLQTVCD